MTLNELRKHIEEYERHLNSIRSKKFEDSMNRFVKLGQLIEQREKEEKNNAKI